MGENFAGLGHQNLVEHCRQSTRWCVGGQLHEAAGVMLFTAGPALWVDSTGAFRLDPQTDPGAVVEQADELFSASGRDYFVKVRDSGPDDDLRDACKQAGLISFSWSEPEMVCASRVAEMPMPPNLTLRVVATKEQVDDFVAVSADAYADQGTTPENVAAAFSRPDELLASRDLITLVAYLDGQPVATGHMLLSHDIAGIYWVGTIRAARGRGIGETVSRALTNGGFDRGARAVTLQATGMAEHMYRRIGYETPFCYETYLRLWARRRRQRPSRPVGTARTIVQPIASRNDEDKRSL